MGFGGSASMAPGGDHRTVAGYSGGGDVREPCVLRHLSCGESAIESDASPARLLRFAYLSTGRQPGWPCDSYRMGRAGEEVIIAPLPGENFFAKTQRMLKKPEESKCPAQAIILSERA